LLEVGIARGGSIQAWADYFKNANIFGVDFYPYLLQMGINFNDPRITTFWEDAYTEAIINKLKHLKFDIVIDDGPHTLESQKKFIELYSPLINSGGYIVIEDIASIESARELHKIILPITSFSMIVDRNEVSNYGGNEINLIGIIK
jgi:cephalosporin hydroxylase